MIRASRALRVPETLAWGVILALGTAVISGVSIFVNATAVKQLPDAAVYTTLKNGVAALVLFAGLAATVKPSAIRAMPARSWAWLILIGLIGGSVPFLLFFSGLAQASAPSAAFIHKTLFVWVALLAVPLLGERLGLLQLGAIAILLVGQALILTPAGVSWGPGETMIAAATLLWAVETIVARRVLRTTPAAVVAAGRLGFGLIILVGYLALTGKVATIASLTAVQLGWVVVTGALLSGYVATWFAALKRAPASVVTSILVLGAPVTAALQGLQTGALPATTALAGQLLILIGGAVLVGQVVRRLRLAPVPAAA